MMYAVISGDIVSSTSLQGEDKRVLEQYLQQLLIDLKTHFNVYGRVIKGDYLECVVPDATQVLRVALAIKSFVKGIPIDIDDYTTAKKRAKLFKSHGIRLAIGYGELERFDTDAGIIDGEAIYFSGRLINSASTYDKERIVIKNTLFFASKNESLNKQFEAILALLDILLLKATSRQSEVLYLKLLGFDEETIAQRLDIDQSVVNRHSTSVGWNAIDTVVTYTQSLF